MSSLSFPDLRTLIETSRPQFYFVPMYFYIAPFVILESAVTLPVVIQFATLSFPLSFFINGVNDIYDVEADELDDLRKEGETIHEKYDDLRVYKALLALSALVIVLSSLMFKFWNTAFAVLIVFVGYAYSAPPFRLKERPPLDGLSNGVIAVFIAFFLGATTFTSPLVSPLNVVKVLALTFGIAAAHAYYAAIDYEPDKEAGLETAATEYGKRACIASAVVAVVVNYVVFRNEMGLYFEAVVAYILVALLLVLRKPEPRFMLRAAHTIYPAFIVCVVLFFFLDSEGLRVSIEQVGLEFKVGGG